MTHRTSIPVLESLGLAPREGSSTELHLGVDPCQGSSQSPPTPSLRTSLRSQACSSDPEGRGHLISFIAYSFTCDCFDCELS